MCELSGLRLYSCGRKKKKNRWVTQIPSSFETNTSNKINTSDHKQVAFVL